MMDGVQFDQWMSQIRKVFRYELCDLQKCKLLDMLISCSGSVQLNHLSNHLEGFLKRDFLHHLPQELGNYLLSWLDPQTLGRCCAVSKHWNKTISECDEIWERACKIAGYNSDIQGENGLIPHNGTRWKHVYVRMLHQLRSLKDNSAFDSTTLRGHTARVYALYYHNGKIASGSDDLTVRLWDVATGLCLKVLQTHTCADIKFDKNKVVTASFDSTIACWDLESGVRLQQYVGHCGAVFCIDYSDAQNILVSGSADTTVNLWNLTSGELLQRLHGHTEWVIQVLIGTCTCDTDVFNMGDQILLTMDKTEIRIWLLSSSDSTCPCAKILAYPSEEIQGQTFLPRLLFDGNVVACASDMGVLVWDFQSFELIRRVSIPECSNVFLLGMGRVFTLLLDSQHLQILDSSSQSLLSSWKLPSYRKSKRGSNFISGDVRWLNGINGKPEKGLVFAASTPDHSLHMVRWRATER